MDCPECDEPITTVYCFSCQDNLHIETALHGGIEYYNICSERRYDGEPEKQLVAAKAADKRLDFLKLQVPVKPSTKPDLLPAIVTILVQGSDEIPAHRFVLANRSPVFRKMFESEMTESETGVISIGDASHAEMQAVVKFCYTAEIDFTEDVRADEVLRIAHKYQILHLRDRCAEELSGRISKENYVDMMRLSSIYEAKHLQEELAKYLKEHFGDVFPVLLGSV